MKIAVLLVDGAKQIMLTPETEHERASLKMIAPTDKIEAVTKWGHYDASPRHYGIEVERCQGGYYASPRHYGIEVERCQGGYYREFPNSESLMFIVTDQKDKPDASS